MRSRTILLSALGLCALASPQLFTADPPGVAKVEIPVVDADRPLIQIAILLDDSGSMSGLINQAKAHLWDMVNQLVATQKNGVRPKLQVALYHYGDTPFLNEPLIALSDNLDAISEKLFAINGGGGTECCGQVIHNAVTQLAWSSRRDDLKLIFIAGNEPFTQGAYDWKTACKEAIEKGIQVNTIHCGPRETGIREMWEEGAKLADGSFTCIDHNQAVAQIAAPQDATIAVLNMKLNGTYIAYGKQREEMANRQMAQETNAASMAPAALSSRAMAKSSGAYTNSGWDLVDAVKDKKTDLAAIPKEELSAEMQKLSVEELKVVVETKSVERTEIQKQIRELSTQRAAFIVEEEKKQVEKGGAKSLGAVMKEVLAEQAAKKGLK
jgi:hypothetical protein